MNPNYFKVVFIHNSIKVFPRTFGIITAYNPQDQSLTEGQNQKRNKLLKVKISHQMKLLGEIVGSSIDKTHQEPSFVTEGKLPELLKLGKEFEQNAVYWIKQDSLFLLDCNHRKKYQMGSFRKRIRES